MNKNTILNLTVGELVSLLEKNNIRITIETKTPETPETQNTNTTKEDNIVKEVSSLLHTLGIPSNINGYIYIRYAVILALNDTTVLKSITKKLYPSIAKDFNTTPSRVERAMRHAIQTSLDRGNSKVFNDIFGFVMNKNKEKLTNSEYIATLVEWINLNNFF